MTVTDLYRTLHALEAEYSTMDALGAIGHLKDYIREREAVLVTRAREESRTWADIAHALHRDLAIMELLHGRPRHER